MADWIKLTGKLRYNPPRPGLKKIRPGEDWRLVVELDRGIAMYYAWWVFKRYWKTIQLPVWRPHITVLDGKTQVKKHNVEFWKKYEGQVIEFYYSPALEKHWKFWTLPVKQNSQLDEIRKELGINNAHPYHITIGREE